MSEKNKEKQQNDDDVVRIDDEINVDADDASADADAVIKKLRERLKQTESEKQEYLNSWQKTRADYINSRKSEEEDRKAFVKFAEAGAISDILPVLDSFNLAFSRKSEWDSLPVDWQIGIQNIYNQLMSVLTARGLKTLRPLGEMFDPTKHEALANVPTHDKDQDHRVVDVVQEGYTLHDKLIRSAKVRIGEYIPESDS